MKKITAGIVQHACSPDRNTNIAAGISALRGAAEKGATLAILPELHTSLYFCQEEDPALFDLAEPIPGPTTNEFSGIARELGMVVVISLFERRAPGLFHNTAVVIEADGSIAGRYRKMHIPDDPAYYEKYYFTPGDLGFEPVATSVGKLGVLVCWDQWYPEAARLMALAGADILIYPTAIGWDAADDREEQFRQLDAWITIQRANAIANGIPVMTANRAGFEYSRSGRGQRFWGNSFAAGPQGEILARAGSDSGELLIVEIDPGRSEAVRRIWPFLRDRRIDAYGDLLRRFRD